MKDRIPTYPGRVRLIPVAGQENTYDIVRADEPQQEGTPLNKSTLLSDTTKSALELTQSDPTVDDALAKIKNLIDAANYYTDSKAQIEAGYYSGTGTYGENNPNSLSFDFAPKVLIVFRCSTSTTNANGQFIMADARSNYFIQVTSLMTTNFTAGRGFGAYFNVPPYGKKSSDGKTISWYQVAGANYQLNESGIEYGYLAIG